MNRGRHKKEKISIENEKLEQLLELIKKEDYNYTAQVKFYYCGMLRNQIKTVLVFHTKEDILQWFNYLKSVVYIDVITINTLIFKL